MRYRGLEIQTKENIKYVRLSKNRTLSDACSIKLKRKIDQIFDFNALENPTKKTKNSFWRDQVKNK